MGYSQGVVCPWIHQSHSCTQNLWLWRENAAGLYERARFGILCFCLPPKATPSGEELLPPTFSQFAHCSGVDAQALTALYPRIPNNQKHFVFKLTDRQAFHPHDLQPLPLLSSIYNYLYPRVFCQHLHPHQDRKGGERNCLNRWEAAPRDTCISDNICKKLCHFNLFIHNYIKIEACNIEVEWICISRHRLLLNLDHSGQWCFRTEVPTH